MKNPTILITLLLAYNFSFCQLSETGHQQVAQTFVKCIKAKDINRLATFISFPLERPYPIPSIKSAKELSERYSEIFDDSLSALIVNSNINEDWTAMGYRGIMLLHGVVWLEYDGTVIAINYMSDKEISKQNILIERDRETLHESLKEYVAPVHILKTAKFLIRIDQLQNSKFRYAVCSVNSDFSKRPDLVVSGGNRILDGSGGNHRFEFINGEYKYVCFINVMSSDDYPPAELVVYKDKNIILEEPAEIVRQE